MMWMVLLSRALAGPVADRLAETQSLVWSGIDYRAVEIFVPETFSDPAEKVMWGPGGGLYDFLGTFASPEAAWVQLCRQWNEMYVNERVTPIRKELGGAVPVDVPDHCATAPATGPRFRVEAEAAKRPPHLSEADVAQAVASWPATKVDGLGLLVVAERFSKPEGTACVWPTFYDLATRAVLYTKRECAAPKGLGFRNYWFNPVAIVVRDTVERLAAGRL